MQGYFRKRGCTCKKKKCTCGAKWSFTIDVGINPQTGKRKQKTRSGFNTKDEAEKAATQLLYELMSGTYIEEKNTTFEKYTEEWLNVNKNTGKIKPGTTRIRKFYINILLRYFAYIKIKDITKKMYQNTLIAIKNEGYSDTTISEIHKTSKMIFQKAVEDDVIKSNPTKFAIVPKSVKTVEELENEEDLPKYLEKEDLSIFLKTAWKYGIGNDYIWFAILSYTGMRVGEMCALKWKDIDFEKGAISITKTYYNPDGKVSDYILLTPKTKSSKRIIEVDGDILASLKNYKKQQNAFRMKHLNNYHDEGFIIISTHKYKGYPVPIKRIEKHMARLLKKARLNENLTPHSLRHTHVSLLAEAGVGLPEIMERLGHKDDKTTTNIYLHVTETMRKEASQKFSQLMKGLL